MLHTRPRTTLPTESSITQFDQISREYEFTVRSIDGRTELTLQRIDPVPIAGVKAAHLPSFRIEGQDSAASTFNAMGWFDGRWEFYSLRQDCPIRLTGNKVRTRTQAA